MPKESRSRMQKWPSSTLCPPNSTVTGTTHFYPVAIRSAHVTYAQALSWHSGKIRWVVECLRGRPLVSYPRRRPAVVINGIFKDEFLRRSQFFDIFDDWIIRFHAYQNPRPLNVSERTCVCFCGRSIHFGSFG